MDGRGTMKVDEKTSVIIFVATHVPFDPPKNPIYVPLHVGREGKADLGYLGDNLGENISELNPLYGELTGLYWIWQNVRDIDYVGICHYRRYFLNEQGRELTREDCLRYLAEADVLVSGHGECEGSYFVHYGRAHNRKDLEAVGRALKKIYPECSNAFDETMNGSIFFTGNLMITELSVLKAYAEWLFTIFAEASEEIDVSGYDSYHRRVYGFLSEQMLYVYMKAYGLSFRELPVGISQEKAETRELKEQLSVLLEQGKRDEAKQCLQQALAVRPDLLLAGSDVYGELQKLVRVIEQGDGDRVLPILVIVPDHTCYGTLAVFARTLAKELEKLGQRIVTTDGSVGEKLLPEQLENETWKGIVGFQAPVLENAVFRRMKAPKFQFWLDNPCMNRDMLRSLPEDYFILCQDEGYAAYIRNYFHTPNARQLPPAGILQGNVLMPQDANPVRSGEKEYEISFLGTNFPDEELPGGTMKELCRKFYNDMIAHPLLTFEQGYREFVMEKRRSMPSAGDMGADSAKTDDTRLTEGLYEMRAVCRNVSNFFRRKVIKTILDAGYTVHVFGESWKSFAEESQSGGHLIIHPAVPAEVAAEIQAKSKISLNVMTWHKSGMTERIATAMLAGAACLSDETVYLKKHFTEEEIVLFRLDEIEKIPEKLAWLFTDENWKRIAQNGQKRALAEHTWANRAKEILSLMENG